MQFLPEHSRASLADPIAGRATACGRAASAGCVGGASRTSFGAASGPRRRGAAPSKKRRRFLFAVVSAVSAPMYSALFLEGGNLRTHITEFSKTHLFSSINSENDGGSSGFIINFVRLLLQGPLSVVDDNQKVVGALSVVGTKRLTKIDFKICKNLKITVTRRRWNL